MRTGGIGRRTRLKARREELRLSLDQIARAVDVDRKTVWRWETGRSNPYRRQHSAIAETLRWPLHRVDELLAQDDELARFGDPDRATDAEPVEAGSDWTAVLPPDLDDVEALELVRRVEASDAGPATLTSIERGVDRLCRSYTATRPAELLVPLRAYRGYIGTLLDGRVTLRQRRDLTVFAGWVSLLAAICRIDLDQYRAAAVNLDAVRSVAHEAGHPLLAAWAFETEAWQAITDGRFPDAIALCGTALDLANPETSEHVQVTVQRARASARLGLVAETLRLLDAAAGELGRMPRCEHPEHHFTFDPRKLVGYSATTLAWLGGTEDQRAEDYARRAVAQYDVGSSDGRWVRRLALARIDLALVLSRLGQPAEATHLGTLSIDSGWIVASHLWRLRELDHDLTTRYPRLPEARDYHDGLVALPMAPDRDGRAALSDPHRSPDQE